jgi:hypothetical protein
MCAAKEHVRFTPDSDRKSRHDRHVNGGKPPQGGFFNFCEL